MKYKVLLTPVEPSVYDQPNYSGVLADYDVEVVSEIEAETWLLLVSVRKIPTILSTGMITSSICIDGIT